MSRMVSGRRLGKLLVAKAVGWTGGCRGEMVDLYCKSHLRRVGTYLLMGPV